MENKSIKYINRDFSSFKTKLVEFAKTYFPNSYNDFSPSSPGMMFMEMSAYVGDVMSFYLDNQIQETFIQYARQDNNLYELAYMFGYKPKISTAAQTTIDIYQQVPAILSGSSYIPDYSYALTLNENTTLSSPISDKVSFLIEDRCDFSVSSSFDPTEVSIYQIAGNIPQYFLLKKSRKAVSANIKTQSFIFNDFTPFPTISITDNKILGILDITDSDGNKWYEVDHLGQEMVFDNIKNTNPNDPNTYTDIDVPFLLKLKKIQKRFSTRILNKTTLQIQFGAGNPNSIDEEITPNPNNVGLGLPFKKTKLTTAFSPDNFLFTNTYGIAPTNTTLTVRYLSGGGVEANVPSNSLTRINKNTIKFNSINLNSSTADYIFNSLSTTNPQAADGGGSGDSIEIIRQNTLMSISAQNRSVTSNDYLIRALSMPSDYGTISKAHIQQPQLVDNQVSTIETLNLFVLSKDNNGYLSTSSNTLKNNLRTYLSQYRMIGDNIEIRDAFIINIAVDFEIIVLPNFNNNQVILSCIEVLKSHFNIDNWQINQPIFLRDIYVKLDRVEGVQTVKNIKISNKAGVSLGYSEYGYDIEGATQNQIIYPSLDSSIFELKYPNQDIKGKISPL
jgi:hypothetical protein